MVRCKKKERKEEKESKEEKGKEKFVSHITYDMNSLPIGQNLITPCGGGCRRRWRRDVFPACDSVTQGHPVVSVRSQVGAARSGHVVQQHDKPHVLNNKKRRKWKNERKIRKDEKR